jgi:phosphoglycolate phosphatase-like HAD superfamily hydrolase
MHRLSAHIPPDLVVFDIDGTLHNTFAWWSPIIRAGLQVFAQQKGIEIPVPTDEQAEAVVGMKDEGVWAPFLPELRKTVVPMEVDEVSRGTDYLFEGVRPLLQHLRGIGVKVALASNCRSTYMGAMKHGQRLVEISDWQFCLDSPNVETKRDMLFEAQKVSGARKAVMVGDREPDHHAAEQMGWPFVWRQNTRCGIHHADVIWSGDPDELLRVLGLPTLR